MYSELCMFNGTWEFQILSTIYYDYNFLWTPQTPIVCLDGKKWTASCWAIFIVHSIQRLGVLEKTKRVCYEERRKEGKGLPPGIGQNSVYEECVICIQNQIEKVLRVENS